MNTSEIYQVVSIFTNISIIIVGIKIVRHLTRMEFKVDMMWNVFEHKFNIESKEPG